MKSWSLIFVWKPKSCFYIWIIIKYVFKLYCMYIEYFYRWHILLTGGNPFKLHDHLLNQKPNSFSVFVLYNKLLFNFQIVTILFYVYIKIKHSNLCCEEEDVVARILLEFFHTNLTFRYLGNTTIEAHYLKTKQDFCKIFTTKHCKHWSAEVIGTFWNATSL